MFLTSLIRSSLLCSAVLLGPATLAAQKPGAAGPPPRTIAELESRIRDVLTRTKLPAVSIAIVSRDSVLWAAGIGKRDVAGGKDADANTLFRIGSTSKAFTSLMVLLMQQEGKLDLEDPISKYIPEIRFQNQWEATDPVRIVNALEHATGWDDLAFRDYANSDPAPLTLKQGLDFNPTTRTSRWRPGTRVSYCNSGPPVAAYIVEKLEGKPFDELVSTRIFRPIGMSRATYLEPKGDDNVATLYHEDGKTPYPYWHVIERPAGSINASANDMAAYVRFLLNRGAVSGTQLIPAAEIEKMERPRSSITAKAGLPVGYGMHLATYVDSGFVWVGHDGGVEGGLTMMAYRPEQGIGFAYMVNAANGKAYQEIGKLVRGFLTQGEAKPAGPAPGPMPEVAQERAGWYMPDNPRTQLMYFAERLLGLTRVTVTDSALVMKPLLGKAKPYLPVSGTLFRGTDEPVATMALIEDGADGRAAAIEQMGYLLPASYHRVPAILAWVSLGLAALFLLSLVTTVLFALVWLPRKLLGKLKGVKHQAARVWPLIATLSIAGIIGVFALSMDDAITAFGTRNWHSMTLFACTLLFPAAAALGLVAAYRAPAGEMKGWVRCYARTVSLVFAITAAYLAYWGMAGWRSWS